MPSSEDSIISAERGPELRSGRDHLLRNWTAIIALAVIAVLAFAALGAEVVERQTSALDLGVRAWVRANQSSSVVRLSQALSTYGSVTPLACVAIVAALYLLYRRRYLAALPALMAPALGVLAYVTLKNIFARARPSALAQVVEGTYSFPSAHATSSSAICCTLAYVFWREHLVNGVVALLIGVVLPLLVGLSRIYLDVHWITDVLGGWSAGVLVAALGAALYNSIRHVQAGRQSTGEGA
ncbi:MAG: phosphoesterase [Gemmatimonadetes bacterium]|nr:phosphoesterase [Gemmatimonadota bacterium]